MLRLIIIIICSCLLSNCAEVESSAVKATTDTYQKATDNMSNAIENAPPYLSPDQNS